MLIYQASVSGNWKKVFGVRKCVYGSRPVSAHPLGAMSCLLVVSALELGLRHLVGTWPTAGMPYIIIIIVIIVKIFIIIIGVTSCMQRDTNPICIYNLGHELGTSGLLQTGCCVTHGICVTHEQAYSFLTASYH